jgi:hypothetical protein
MPIIRKHVKALFVVCAVVVEQMLSGWLVATRQSPRNLAHAHISNFYQGFSPGPWTVPSLSLRLPEEERTSASLYTAT